MRQSIIENHRGWCFGMTIALIGFGAFPLQAAIEVVTGALAAQSTDFRNAPVQIPQFDPRLGQLTSISIEADATGQQTQFFENLGPAAGSVTIAQRLDLLLASANHHALLRWGQSDQHTYSYGAYDGSLDYSGSSGGTSGYSVTASGNVTVNRPTTPGPPLGTGSLSPRDFAAFEGAGFLDLYLSARDQFHFLPHASNLALGTLATAGVDLTVTYSFIPVPEASTWLVAGFAILALAVRARRLRIEP
jgi:hypothetical protein